MSVGRRFGSWLKSIVRRERLESDMDAELRFHIEQRADDWMRDADSKGMTREEALRRARLEFGAVDKVKEECREARGASWVESLTQDLRFGVRTMRRSPGFTAVAVLSLGLGIGANTAIFTLINDILLKSLPVRDPQRLVTFGKESGAGIVDGISGSIDLFPYDFFKSLQAQDEAFQDITAYSSFQPSATVRRNDVPNSGVTTAVTHLVAGNFFDVLGAEPLMGRTLEPSDDNGAASRPVAVISYGYWQRGFGGQPDVLGKTMLVNSTGFTVIGVMPPKFYGVELDDNPPDMWLPIGFQEQVMLMPSLLGPQGLYWTHMMGRAKPSVTRAQSQQWVGLKLREYMTDREGADLTPERKQEIAKSYIEMLPGAAGISNTRQDYEQPLEILMGVVVLVLMIACANLANFLLAKAASREQEIATRLALGAGRARVVRQMLTETLLPGVT